MRISDWSSDVCSSDLKRIFSVLPIAGRVSESFPGFVHFQEDVDIDHRSLYYDATQSFGRFAFIVALCHFSNSLSGNLMFMLRKYRNYGPVSLYNLKHDLCREQIGRASVRERVCQ